jgi:hypothetical protein
MSISISRLGVRIDGWADILEDAASKAQEAQQALEHILRDKQMPDISINPTRVLSCLSWASHFCSLLLVHWLAS